MDECGVFCYSHPDHDVDITLHMIIYMHVCLCMFLHLHIIFDLFSLGVGSSVSLVSFSCILFPVQMEELRAEVQQQTESTGTLSRSKAASLPPSHPQISVTVVTEFVRWNEEAISRCTLFSSQVKLLTFGFYEYYFQIS